MRIQDAEHLLVLPVPFRENGGHLWLESQAAHGVQCWRKFFGSLIIAAPVLPENSSVVSRRLREMSWVAADEVADGVQFVPLPWAYRLREYLRYRRGVAEILTACIQRSTYLQFAIGGLAGDWAALGARLAQGMGRAYAVHMDRVEHRVIRLNGAGEPASRRFKNWLISPLMQRYHEGIIRNAAVSLCHGADCLAAYQHLNTRSHLVHNIHLEAHEAATLDEVFAKAARVEREAQTVPLEIVYSGRAVADKAPMEWLRALAMLKESGTPFRATWLGEGSLREKMMVERDALGLKGQVELPGFEADREKVFATIKRAHVFVFTHITPESPRCLVESLLMGTPIVGYESAYSRDLISRHAGGRLVPMHDIRRLAMTLAKLAGARGDLAQMMRQARRDAGHLDAYAVFKHRSALIKQYAGQDTGMRKVVSDPCLPDATVAPRPAPAG